MAPSNSKSAKKVKRRPGLNAFGRPAMPGSIGLGRYPIPEDTVPDEESKKSASDQKMGGVSEVEGASKTDETMHDSTGDAIAADNDASRMDLDDDGANAPKDPGSSNPFDMVREMLVNARREREGGKKVASAAVESDSEPIDHRARLKKRRGENRERHVSLGDTTPQYGEGRFLNSPHEHPDEPQHGWVGVKQLGKGGQGRAGLWVKVDERMVVVDRMVIKEAFCPSKDVPGRDHWVGGTPREGYVGLLLSPRIKGGETDLVTTRALLGHKEQGRYRIYMDFIGNDSLETLSGRQTVPGARDKYELSLVHTGGRPENAEVPYPEPFLWHTLNRLAMAAQEMAGPVKVREQHKEWPNMEVVHLDIKPDNIFLAPPHPTDFPFYPRPKIGDFGSARICSIEDPRNPLGWQDATTRGFMAPEMDRKLRNSMRKEVMAAIADGEPIPDYDRCSHATNVWQIGQVLRVMMQLKNKYKAGTEQLEYSYLPREYWTPSMVGLKKAYSADLTELVTSCLDPVPSQRPSPWEIITICACNEEQQYDGMESRSTGASRKEHHLVSTGTVDDYRLGMVFKKE